MNEIPTPSQCLTTALACAPLQPYLTTQETMVRLKPKLAKTTEDSIKSIKEQLQHNSSERLTLCSHNPETDEIIFD